jgi:hypothetical protein
MVLAVNLGLLQDAIQHIFQLVGTGDAALAPFDLAVAEYDESGYALDTIGRRHCGIAVDIHLQDRDGFAHFVFNFFEDGGHHLARAAPFGGKVYQYRLVALDYFSKRLFFCGGHISGFTVKLAIFYRCNCRTKPGKYGTMSREQRRVCINGSGLPESEKFQGGRIRLP